MEYEIIVGLEVHVQSKTKSKMFCSCATNYFGKAPNTHTCPVCLGLPGAMPVPNKAAIDNCVKLALALNCTINKETKFDRKSYFYPDLPKGYQISQYDQPIGEKGFIEVLLKNGSKKIRVTRVHQEEDTGKSLHEGGETHLDYNKSSVPLIEIVSEPDMFSAEEVTAYAKMLKLIVQYLDVSDADMEKGQMRFEINMSLREKGKAGLPNYKVEVKNIGSISVLEKVVVSEYKRQQELLDQGQTPIQETRGLVDMSGKTATLRVKESEADYRYFAEPDIPALIFTDEYLEKVRSTLPELPLTLQNKYVNDFNLSQNIAETIVGDISLKNIFENSIANETDIKVIQVIANLLSGVYISYTSNSSLHQNFSNNFISEVATAVANNQITKDTGKELFIDALEKGLSPAKQITEKGLKIENDTTMIDGIVANVISNNEKAVTDFKSGKNPNAVMFLVGQVMRELKGRADAKTVENLIREKLG